MLQKRILTAAVMLVAVVMITFLTSTAQFALMTTVIVMLGVLEWCKMLGFSSRLQAMWILVTAIALFVLYTVPEIWYPICHLAAFSWVCALVLVCCFAKKPILTDFLQKRGVLWGVLSWWFLIPAWLGLLILKQTASNDGWVLFAMAIVWSVDTSAYFAGKRWGNVKLAPAVSPGKTFAGLYGGLIAAALLAVLTALSVSLSMRQLLLLVVVSVIAAGFSILGDLFESMLKRILKVKDSGSWLPGHGGILDRVDGMTAAIPFFAVSFKHVFS